MHGTLCFVEPDQSWQWVEERREKKQKENRQLKIGSSLLRLHLPSSGGGDGGDALITVKLTVHCFN